MRQIDQELVQIEETIKSLFSDVNTLQEGRQPQAGELYRGVRQLHDKWMAVHTTMQVTNSTGALIAATSLRAFVV